MIGFMITLPCHRSHACLKASAVQLKAHFQLVLIKFPLLFPLVLKRDICLEGQACSKRVFGSSNAPMHSELHLE